MYQNLLFVIFSKGFPELHNYEVLQKPIYAVPMNFKFLRLSLAVVEVTIVYRRNKPASRMD